MYLRQYARLCCNKLQSSKVISSMSAVLRNHCNNSSIVQKDLLIYDPNQSSRFFDLKHSAKLSFSLIGLLTAIGLIDEKEESELMDTMKRGEYLFKVKKEYDKSERMFHVALKLAQDFQHEGASIFIFDRLANIAFKTNQYEKSITLFTYVIRKLLLKGIPDNDLAVVNISSKISFAYEKLNKLKQAEVGYKFCIDKLEVLMPKALKDEDLNMISLWIQVLHLYSNYLYKHGDIRKSLPYAKQASQLAIKYISSNNHHVMLLNDLAKVYLKMRDLENAKVSAEEGLKLAKQMPIMPYISNFYIILGIIAAERDLYTEAKKNCEHALKRANEHDYEDGIKASEQCLTYITEREKVTMNINTDQNLSNAT